MKYLQNLRMIIIATFFTYSALSVLHLCYATLHRTTTELVVDGLVALIVATAAIDVTGKWRK